MLHLLLIFAVITSTSCKSTKVEQIVASAGEAFSFDCQLEESVFFAKQLDNWSEIQENDKIYMSLNLNFNYLTKENILRVTSNSVDPVNLGYYGCRKATWATTDMNRIYKLVIAGNSRLFTFLYSITIYILVFRCAVVLLELHVSCPGRFMSTYWWFQRWHVEHIRSRWWNDG